MNIGGAERPAHTVTQLQPCQIFFFLFFLYLLYCQLPLILAAVVVLHFAV
jgi:hypothetical protein